MIGKRFGRLVVLRKIPGGQNPKWEFLCDCGTRKEIIASNVKRGLTRSCGCLNREKIAARGRDQLRTHGLSKSTEFKIWQGVRQRCENPKAKDYPKYGGRGIGVCERWRLSFENFYNDMGTRPTDKSIDRIDFDGDYSPENCRWATTTEQNRNKRDNLIPGSLAAIVPEGSHSAEYQRLRKAIVRTI